MIADGGLEVGGVLSDDERASLGARRDLDPSVDDRCGGQRPVGLGDEEASAVGLVDLPEGARLGRTDLDESGGCGHGAAQSVLSRTDEDEVDAEAAEEVEDVTGVVGGGIVGVVVGVPASAPGPLIRIETAEGA